MHYMLVIASLFSLSGCQKTPSLAIAGSYFPAWLLMCFASIAGTILIRLLLIRLGIDEVLRFKLFFYTCLALSLCFALVLTLYSH